MDDSANTLDLLLDSTMAGLDLEKSLNETQGINELMDKLAPQEMDRVVNVLSVGLRVGLAQIIGEQIKDSQKELKILKTSVSKELQDAAEDLDINDVEKKLNIIDFVNRVHDSLPRFEEK